MLRAIGPATDPWVNPLSKAVSLCLEFTAMLLLL
jgi:hypothetical protein